MKKLFTLFAIVTTITIFAQAPQGFNYQAIVRNSAGALITNQIVGFKFSIKQTSASGTTVYSETQYVTPDNLGQVSLVVGTGTPSTGTFATISWASSTYYLAIELNTGSGFVQMGTTQLMSVPYALNGITTTQADAIVAMQAQIVAMQAQITSLLPTFTTTTIGTQVWTTKNLDVATYSDGTVIPQVTDPTAWANLTTGAWCYNNNNSETGATYGKYYNWYAVAGIHDTDPNTPNKKLAPTGYHIPSDAEWTTLTTYLGGESIAGGKMKSTGTSLWNTPNTEATNSSGFTGLPGGSRYNDGAFYGIGDDGYWWSSSENGTTYAWNRYLNYFDGNATRLYNSKKNGFSVRCLRD